MKVSIDRDELWPVYFVVETRPFFADREIPTEVVEHWLRVQESYDQVQQQMRHYYEEEKDEND